MRSCKYFPHFPNFLRNKIHNSVLFLSKPQFRYLFIFNFNICAGVNLGTQRTSDDVMPEANKRRANWETKNLGRIPTRCLGWAPKSAILSRACHVHCPVGPTPPLPQESAGFDRLNF